MALREELREAHWAYMDRFAGEMIARGPTLTDDGETATGSVHIVDLPDPAAARAFAFDEPNYQAGVYRDVLLRRWRNMLGRTMWEFPGGREGGNRYLVLGLGAEQGADLAEPADEQGLIAFGPLLSDDGISRLVQRRWSAQRTRMRPALPWAPTGTPASRYTTGSSAGGQGEGSFAPGGERPTPEAKGLSRRAECPLAGEVVDRRDVLGEPEVAQVGVLAGVHRGEQDVARPSRRGDVRLVERGGDLRLAQEPLAEARVVRELRDEHLERDLPAAGALSEVHGARRATPDQARNPIPGDDASGREDVRHRG